MRRRGDGDQGNRPRGLATTLSLIAVFLPVAFMGGIPGRFLSSFGFTMAFSIAVSLLRELHADADDGVALAEGARRTGSSPLGERVVDAFYRPIERVYSTVLRFVMKHRWIVVLAFAR